MVAANTNIIVNTGAPIGRPVGNLRLGRRYTAEEFTRLSTGTTVETIIASGPRQLTREEFYTQAFGIELVTE